MKLEPSHFSKIRDGHKTIEVRLNDEKRQLLRVGDTIQFTLTTDPNQSITTEITGLERFPSFQEMFAAYPPEMYGCTNQDNWNLMYQHYSIEDEQKYGVLAIQIRMIRS